MIGINPLEQAQSWRSNSRPERRDKRALDTVSSARTPAVSRRHTLDRAEDIRALKERIQVQLEFIRTNILGAGGLGLTALET